MGYYFNSYSTYIYLFAFTMRKKSISIAARKAKGRKLQKWVCERLSTVFNIPWGYEDEKEIQPRLMGQGGTDIVLRGKAATIIPWSIECKWQEKWNVPEFIKQAKENCKEGTSWLLVMKKNNQIEKK
jgi:hypothetical protein